MPDLVAALCIVPHLQHAPSSCCVVLLYVRIVLCLLHGCVSASVIVINMHAKGRALMLAAAAAYTSRLATISFTVTVTVTFKGNRGNGSDDMCRCFFAWHLRTISLAAGVSGGRDR